MRHQDIAVGDTLKLKRDNAYGFGPIVMEVLEVRTRGHYKTPFIITELGAFKPSDFLGKREIVTSA